MRILAVSDVKGCSDLLEWLTLEPTVRNVDAVACIENLLLGRRSSKQ